MSCDCLIMASEVSSFINHLHCSLQSWRMKILWDGNTVGVIRICSLVFVNSSAQDASIFKISVAIFKRRSWGFQNTPNLWDLQYFKPSYGHLKKIEVSKNNFDWQFCSKYKQILNYLKTSLFSKCHNLAQNHPNFTSWGCFGMLMTASWRWPQIFWT